MPAHHLDVGAHRHVDRRFVPLLGFRGFSHARVDGAFWCIVWCIRHRSGYQGGAGARPDLGGKVALPAFPLRPAEDRRVRNVVLATEFAVGELAAAIVSLDRLPVDVAATAHGTPTRRSS